MCSISLLPWPFGPLTLHIPDFYQWNLSPERPLSWDHLFWKKIHCRVPAKQEPQTWLFQYNWSSTWFSCKHCWLYGLYFSLVLRALTSWLKCHPFYNYNVPLWWFFFLRSTRWPLFFFLSVILLAVVDAVLLWGRVAIGKRLMGGVCMVGKVGCYVCNVVFSDARLNEETVWIFTLYTVIQSALSQRTLSGEDTPLEKTQNSWKKVLWSYVMLSLTKGHLSNDRIVWQKGCPY